MSKLGSFVNQVHKQLAQEMPDPNSTDKAFLFCICDDPDSHKNHRPPTDIKANNMVNDQGCVMFSVTMNKSKGFNNRQYRGGNYL